MKEAGQTLIIEIVSTPPSTVGQIAVTKNNINEVVIPDPLRAFKGEVVTVSEETL